jgi:hypothetical protein
VRGLDEFFTHGVFAVLRKTHSAPEQPG